jgi:hypothetical protein
MRLTYISYDLLPRCVASAFFFAAGAAVAASGPQVMAKREPGLWEIHMKQDSALNMVLQSMQEELAKMAPTQRQHMERSMKSMLGAQTSKPMVLKQCLTPEMAARELEPHVDSDMECKNSTRVVSATEVYFSFTCQNPSGRFSGEGRAWDVSARSYHSELTMQGVVDGRPVKLDTAHTAKWIGEDCQGVKP